MLLATLLPIILLGSVSISCRVIGQESPDKLNHVPRIDDEFHPLQIESPTTSSPDTHRKWRESRDLEDRSDDAIDDLYISSVLHHRIHKLNSDNVCWYPSGIKGLVDVLYTNISKSSKTMAEVPQGIFNITSSGNTFSINLTDHSLEVNGLSDSTYLVLTYIHIFTMAVAFFLVYPVMILLKTIILLCNLVHRPLGKNLMTRWYDILYLFAFVPLVAAGISVGIVAMGSSDNFRTQHGIIGLIAAGFTVVEIIVFFVRNKTTYQYRLSIRTLRWLRHVDAILCQLVLLLSSYSLGNGFDDLVVMGLCSVSISMTWAFSIGMVVVFVWNAVQAAMTIEWFLGRRVAS